MDFDKVRSSVLDRDWKNVHHVGIMWAPNVLHPAKLRANVAHPIGEVFHTSHKQYPIELIPDREHYLVEHNLFDKLVTVDLIVPDTFRPGIVNRTKQLFDRNFYYGHAGYFPQPFKLIDRTLVGRDFNMEQHLARLASASQ